MKIAVDDKKIIFKPEGTIDATNADLSEKSWKKALRRTRASCP